jgi:hypothetical protein
MNLPEISESDRMKPISFDPKEQRFLFFDDAVRSREPLLSPLELSRADLKRLIIERHRRGPDYTVVTSAGETYTRNSVIRAIERDTEFGNAIIDAEAKYISALVKQIADALAGM